MEVGSCGNSYWCAHENCVHEKSHSLPEEFDLDLIGTVVGDAGQ